MITELDKAIEHVDANMNKKPPLGIRPRFLITEERIDEIVAAMHRYEEENMTIPLNWFSELKELLSALKSMERKQSNNTNEYGTSLTEDIIPPPGFEEEQYASLTFQTCAIDKITACITHQLKTSNVEVIITHNDKHRFFEQNIESIVDQFTDLGYVAYSYESPNKTIINVRKHGTEPKNKAIKEQS